MSFLRTKHIILMNVKFLDAFVDLVLIIIRRYSLDHNDLKSAVFLLVGAAIYNLGGKPCTLSQNGEILIVLDTSCHLCLFVASN